MTLRTKSRGWQWMVWLFAALVLLAVYVVLSRCLYNAVGWNPFDVRCHRLMLPLLALFVFVARETRWDGVLRKGEREAEGKGEGREAKERGEGANDGGADGVRALPHEGRAGSMNPPQSCDHHCSPPSFTITSSQPQPSTSALSPISVSSLTGEELFNMARVLPHQLIPDFGFDGEYLELLRKSAAANYAPALAKLGEYAMRRAAWVEAYYWMTLARRNGMHGLSPVLREIRRNWATVGFPDEAENVSSLFSAEAGSVGRALLHLDSGRAAGVAREFLKANYPEFL